MRVAVVIHPYSEDRARSVTDLNEKPPNARPPPSNIAHPSQRLTRRNDSCARGAGGTGFPITQDFRFGFLGRHPLYIQVPSLGAVYRVFSLPSDSGSPRRGRSCPLPGTGRRGSALFLCDLSFRHLPVPFCFRPVCLPDVHSVRRKWRFAWIPPSARCSRTRSGRRATLEPGLA